MRDLYHCSHRRRRRRRRSRSPGQARSGEDRQETRHITLPRSDFEWGAEHFFRWGRMMPPGAIDSAATLRRHPVGRRGASEIPRTTPRSTGCCCPIPRAFRPYANVGRRTSIRRPVAAGAGEGRRHRSGVVRENTEGEYTQVGRIRYSTSRKRLPFRPRCSPRRGIGARGAVRRRAGGEAQIEEARVHVDHEITNAQGLPAWCCGPHVSGAVAEPSTKYRT